MKILIFAWRDIMNPSAGGSEVYFHEIAKRWCGQGHQVTMICSGWKGCRQIDSIDNIKIIRLGKGYSIYLYAPLAYLSMKKHYDVIVDVENGIPFFTPLFCRKKKFLHIHHVHKDVWFKEKKGLIAGVGYCLENYLMPLIYRKTKVITISRSSYNDIREDLGLKPIGIVNPAYTVYDNLEKVNKTKHPTILFLNRLKKYKGADVLIKAFKRLEREFDGIELIIAGSGDYSDELKKMAKGSNITFLGYVSEDKKYQLMKSSWVFVNPSFKEGFGIVNLEASHFGLPIVGSDVSGIRDSIMSDLTGILFQYGNHISLYNSIKKLLVDNELREEMGENGKSWARMFNWGLASEEYLKLIGRTK